MFLFALDCGHICPPCFCPPSIAGKPAPCFLFALPYKAGLPLFARPHPRNALPAPAAGRFFCAAAGVFPRRFCPFAPFVL